MRWFSNPMVGEYKSNRLMMEVFSFERGGFSRGKLITGSDIITQC